MTNTDTTTGGAQRGLVTFCVVVALAVAGCSLGSPSAACDPARPGDDVGGFHALPGADITYRQSPPTGGTHLSAGPPDTGFYPEPLAEIAQVSALENGYVIINYDPESTSPDDVDQLRAFSDNYDPVIVTAQAAPLDEGSVVLTAWGVIQPCDGYDTATIRAFIRQHLSRNQADE